MCARVCVRARVRAHLFAHLQSDAYFLVVKTVVPFVRAFNKQAHLALVARHTRFPLANQYSVFFLLR